MKFLLIPTGLLCMFIAGYYAYNFLNRKIKDSKGVISLLLYAVALFASLGVWYFGGLFVIAKSL